MMDWSGASSGVNAGREFGLLALICYVAGQWALMYFYLSLICCHIVLQKRLVCYCETNTK